jgi:hypothetical protein
MRQVAESGDEYVRYRLTWVQRVFPVLLGGSVVFVIMGLMSAAGHGTFTAHEVRPLALGWLLGTVLLLIPWQRADVTLTPERVIIRARGRTIEWRQVADITVEKSMESRAIILWYDNGGRTKLGAPLSFLDGEFDEKARTVTEYWQRQRSLSFQQPS